MYLYNTFKTCALLTTLSLGALPLHAQTTVIDDGKPNWACRDTSKYTSTGYIAGSVGLVDVTPLPNSPILSLSTGIPIAHSDFGVAGLLEYNSIFTNWAARGFKQFYLTGGLFATFQLSDRYSFDIRLMGGVMYGRYPEQNYQQEEGYTTSIGNYTSDSTIYSNVHIQGMDVWLWVFQGGIEFKYMVTHKAGIKLNIDYMAKDSFISIQTTTPVYANVTSTNTTTGAHNNYTYQYQANPFAQPYGVSDHGVTIFSLGIYYQLGNASLVK
jgi:hypothetical protein